MCAFIPKYHWLPLRVWCICGSRALALFLVEDGALMILASTNVPWFIIKPRSRSKALIVSKICTCSPWVSRRRRKPSRVVASGTDSRPRSMPRKWRNA